MTLVLFLLMIVAFIVAIATILILGIILVTFRRRSGKRNAVYLTFSLIPALLVTAAFGGFVWLYQPVDISEPKDLAGAYKYEFGTLPPSDVSNLQARQVVVGDSGAVWLRFNASAATIEHLTKKFSPSNAEKFGESQNANSPNWWKPEIDQIDSYYSAENWSPYFESSTASLAINRTKGAVYFCHRGSN